MKRLAMLVLLLSGCAERYLLVMTSSMLDCPRDQLKVKYLGEIQYRVTGCGRRAQCQKNIWYGPDDWTCEEMKE